MKIEEINLLSIALGYMKTQSIMALARLDVASHIPIGESRSIFDIARQLEVNPEFLYRTMRAVSVLGVFKEDDQKDGHFSHTPMSKGLLDKDGIVNALMFLCHPKLYTAWQNLDETIKEGTACGPRQIGFDSIWDILKKDNEFGMAFGKAMGSITLKNINIIKGTDFGSFKTIVDLGGCNGELVLELLKKYPNLKGVNFDQKHVIESNKKLDRSLLDRDVLSRFSEVGGSFLESVPPSDLYIIKSVLHNWDDFMAKKILETVAKSILPGGKFIIYDMILDPKRELPTTGMSFMDLNMMHNVNGKERCEKDWRNLAEVSGFNVDSIERTPEIVYGRIILSKKTSNSEIQPNSYEIFKKK
eukprot:gene2592-3212_t